MIHSIAEQEINLQNYQQMFLIMQSVDTKKGFRMLTWWYDGDFVENIDNNGILKFLLYCKKVKQNTQNKICKITCIRTAFNIVLQFNNVVMNKRIDINTRVTMRGIYMEITKGKYFYNKGMMDAS